MEAASSDDPTVQAFGHKMAQLHAAVTDTQGQLEGELMDLLTPADLISLWRLRSILDNTESLIEHSVDSRHNRITEEMLELVDQVEKIITQAQAHIDRWKKAHA